MQPLQSRVITRQAINVYEVYLQEQEKSSATIRMYIHDLGAIMGYFSGAELTKAALIDLKNRLAEQYAAASVNTILAALNSFLSFMGWHDLKVKALKVQKQMFCEERRELTQDEYKRLIRAAESKGDQRLSFVMQTICATGIRVSELKFITVKAVRTGRAEISNKGKRRTVILPKRLCQMLSRYIRTQGISFGAVFLTKNGKPLDRSNIWRSMKELCKKAGVKASKVFPHNLRHLFARAYYSIEKDLSRLADILGHSNINTTRIYTMESGTVHAKQLARLNLIIT